MSFYQFFDNSPIVFFGKNVAGPDGTRIEQGLARHRATPRRIGLGIGTGIATGVLGGFSHIRLI